MDKNKYKYRIVLKSDGWYYVQKKIFWIWFDMRPYYDKCVSHCKSTCEQGIEIIKAAKERGEGGTQVIGYYN